MKTNTGSASIIHGTNKLISSSHSDFSTIRAGSFIKFTKDTNHYIAGQISPLFFLVEFKKIGDRQIEINGDTGININIFDSVTISFKEWEIQSVINLTNPGKGYNQGDILILDGGKSYINVQDNLRQFGKIKVESVDENGSINRFSVVEKGRYSEIPNGLVKLLGGKGENAEANILFKNCDNRVVLERDVENVQFDGQKTIITLTYNIPPEIELGKVGVNKYGMILTSNYEEQTKINEKYEITRDFTPYLGLPLLTKGSLTPDLVINQIAILIDKKFKDQDEKIAKMAK